MRKLRIAFLFLILLAASALAETSAEALAAFRKNLQKTASDKKLPAPAREAMRMWGERFASGELRGLSGENLREWMTGQGDQLPADVRQSALALAEALDREAAARVAEIETLARETLEGLMQAGHAAALEPLAERARAALQSGQAAPMSERSQAALQMLANAQRLVGAWQAAFAARAAGQPAEALRALGGLASETQGLSPEIARQLREKAREMARTLGVLPPAEAEKELRGIVAQVLAAETAKDLDPILQNLRAKSSLWNAARELGGTESAELAGRGARFAASWQEYLAAKSAGSAERVRTILTNLANSESDVPGVPRSMLLERSLAESSAPQTSAHAMTGHPGVTRFYQLLETCKTLSDLETKLPAIESIGPDTPTNAFAREARLLEELRTINRDYQDAKAAIQPQVAPVRGTASESSLVRELRRQLTVFTLARQFASASLANDTPAAYLRRRLLAAREVKDWRVMQRALEAATTAGVRELLCLPADGAALTHYLAGMNFEEAGVARFAVASYLAALQTGSDFIPLDDIRTRLAKLRTEHAADYDDGLKVAVAGGLPMSAVEKDWRGEGKTPDRPPGSPASRPLTTPASR